MRLIGWLLGFLVLLSACLTGGSSPEDTARGLVKAAVRGDLELLGDRLSGEPLRRLVATSGSQEAQRAFRLELLRLAQLPEDWHLRVARAWWQEDGLTVDLHLCLQISHQKSVSLSELSWRMSLINGDWKLVAYN